MVQRKKMTELMVTLYEQFAASKRLEAAIKKNMDVLGYGKRDNHFVDNAKQWILVSDKYAPHTILRL